MVIRSKLLAWSIALSLSFLLLDGGHVQADPLTDSFTGSRRGGSHKAAKKPGSAVKPAGKSSPKSSSKPSSKSSPKASSRPSSRSPSSDDEFANEPEPTPPPPPPRREPSEERPRSKKAAPASDEPEESSFDQGASEGDEQDEKPKAKKRPTVVKKAVPKKVVAKKGKRPDDSEEEGEGNDGDEDEDDEDETEAFTSLPVIIPHMISFAAGGAIMGRNFQFGAPAQLQKESSFPRLGFLVKADVFPFLTSDAWWRQFGLAAFFAAEPVGQASVADVNTGASVNTPVKQTRWGAELRYVLPLGDHVVLTPGVGLLSSSFTLATKMPIAPSQCTATAASACLPNTGVTLFSASGSLRIALAPEIGLSLAGAYLLGLGVTNKPVNEIGYEAATSAGGFQAEVGLNYLLTDWLAVRGEFPITRVNYQFHTASVAYKSAAETYYGLNLQLVLLLK